MEVKQLSVNARSACFELDCGQNSIYHTPCRYEVTLNGCVCTCGDTNVFSLFGLAPAMSYRLRVTFEDGAALTHEFVTPAERICLDVTRFGCVADGTTDCTGGLQAAIAACGAGGGTVLVPKGTYLTYPLFLSNNVLLYLDEGAVLLGGTDRARYPVLPGMVTDENGEQEHTFATWEGNPLDSHASLITALGVEHAALAGPGVIDANAAAAGWWNEPKRRGAAWRPRTVFAAHARTLTLLGITLKNSPAWTVHPYYCNGVDILDVHIENPPDSANTDGCNPESCENVRIIGADISVGDDCISVKSGKHYMAAHHPAPARNILVRNCLLRRGHGAIVVGSEIACGVHGLLVERCLMRDTDRGLRIKTRRGRGSTSVIDGVSLSDIVMEHVLAPFVVNMFYCCDPDGHTELVRDRRLRAVDGLTPAVRSIQCKRIRCSGAQQAGVFLYGLPESPIEFFEMEDVSIAFAADAAAGLPAMMDDLAPVKKLALFAANVTRLVLRRVSFTGFEGECLQLQYVKELLRNDGDSGGEVPYGQGTSHTAAAAVY